MEGLCNPSIFYIFHYIQRSPYNICALICFDMGVYMWELVSNAQYITLDIEYVVLLWSQHEGFDGIIYWIEKFP